MSAENDNGEPGVPPTGADRSPGGLTEDEQLAARWDTVAYRAQGSPFEDLSISCLAKSGGTRPWIRGKGKNKNDTVARYVYLSFDELMEVEGLDRKSALLLLEICEATFRFEQECEDIGAFGGIDQEANAQRMRFVEEFGLYRDFPIRLSNLDADVRELCVAEGVETFIQLMEFLDRLSDKSWIGGTFRELQNVFAHGDEKGLTRFFPYRVGHRGFHFPEAISFCLSRLSKTELQSVFEYHSHRGRRGFSLRGGRMRLPEVVENRLLPEILECLHYFGSRQARLLVRLHDSAFLCRELMYLDDPQVEGVLHWLIHLALGVFKPQEVPDVRDDLKQLSMGGSEEICEELKRMARCGGAE